MEMVISYLIKQREGLWNAWTKEYKFGSNYQIHIMKPSSNWKISVKNYKTFWYVCLGKVRISIGRKGK